MCTILQINVTVNYNSTGRIAEDIGHLAIKKGWKSYIAYGRYPRKSLSQLIYIGSKKDTYIHALFTRLFDRHGLASKKATLQLIENIEKIKPNIIHLHNIHGYYLNYPILFRYLCNLSIPIVWTLHDCWAFTGHCVHFEFIGCERWKKGCYNCPQKRNYPRSIGLDRSYKNYFDKKTYFTSNRNLTIVTVSNWLLNLVSQSFLKSNRLKQIYNGVDLNVFSPYLNNEEILKKYNIKTKFYILGVTNVWTERKGLKDFIKLKDKIPNDCTIVLVGLTLQQLKALPEGIIGIQRTENITQLAQLYSAAILYLNLTYEDNFPTTNIEALACGTPVLTYKTGGSIEAVTDSTGFVVEQGDLDMVISAIKIVKNKGKNYYSQRCRKRAINYFDKEERYQEYFNLYNELLAHK